MAITVKKKGAYKVGYKKPPKHSQFPKGQSGNPNARPTGAKNLKTDLEEELQERIAIKEGGAPKNVSKQRAMIKALMAKAVQGDARAANMLLTLLLKLVSRDEMDAEDRPFTKTDKQVLEDFKASLLSKPKSKGD